MPSPYADPPARGEHETAMQGMNARERANYKATQFGSLDVIGRSFTKDGITVTYLSPFTVFGFGADGKGVQVTVSAAVNGVTLRLEDNLFQFVNPPLKTPNGTWRVEAGVDVPNMQENLEGAAQLILIDAIKGQAARQGINL